MPAPAIRQERQARGLLLHRAGQVGQGAGLAGQIPRQEQLPGRVRPAGEAGGLERGWVRHPEPIGFIVCPSAQEAADLPAPAPVLAGRHAPARAQVPDGHDHPRHAPAQHRQQPRLPGLRAQPPACVHPSHAQDHPQILSTFHVPDSGIKDAWRKLRAALDRAITQLKDADMYESRGDKRDADGVVVSDSSNFFAAENVAAMASAATAAFALVSAGPTDSRFVLGASAENLRNLEDVNRELATYIRMPMAESMDECPLAWWRANQRFFPGLATVARAVLCIPATSASVERFFSRAGLTINQLRTRLSSKTVEQLLFLKLNWDDSLYSVCLKGQALEDAHEEAKKVEEGEGVVVTDEPDDEGVEAGDVLGVEDEDGVLGPLDPIGFADDEAFAFLNDVEADGIVQLPP